jgi:prephenate dehydrogenase
VMCPSAINSAEQVDLVKDFIGNCGAIAVAMSPRDHDQTVAITSHTPQILSSLLAAQLLEVAPEHVRVSGQGLRDMTRIASSNPSLWTDILLANADFVQPIMASLSKQLQAVADDLEHNDGSAINSALLRGNQGRALVPGKHGERFRPYATVAIVIQDAPGQLAAIFAVAGAANVNIEDVRIDHALGRAVAVIELDVDPSMQDSLREALIREGWTLRSPSVT